MNIIVTGTRGIPSILGGVETHCEELFPLMYRSEKLEISIICRSAYIKAQKDLKEFKGIKLKSIYSPKSKSLEAIVHTTLAVMYAGIKRPDVLHIHAIGPNLLTPFARLLGLHVVMTHHGPDYERKKWGKMAKSFLKLGEWAGVKFANEVIVISKEIGDSIERKYGRTDSILIPNGVPKAIKIQSPHYLNQLGIEPKKYIFTLGRFVPEKGFDYLIKAWKQSSLSEQFQLVIAGDADHESSYSEELKALAKKQGVILTGFIKGEPLRQLFTHARLFVLPSFYEGLPISLLEAMSYDLDILASNIQANKEVNLPEDFYFETGNIDILAQKLNQKLSVEKGDIVYDMSRYNWENIAHQTFKVYQDAVGEVVPEQQPIPAHNLKGMAAAKQYMKEGLEYWGKVPRLTALLFGPPTTEEVKIPEELLPDHLKKTSTIPSGQSVSLSKNSNNVIAEEDQETLNVG